MNFESMALHKTIFTLFLFLAVFKASALNLGDYADARVSVMDFDTFAPIMEKTNDSIYVINFWATWCAPCVREIPVFEQLHAQYKDKKVKVLLVSLDFPDHLESRVIPFLREHRVQSEVILLDEPNANRWIPLVDESWTGAIPATIIYSRAFRNFYQKEFKFEELENIILPLL